MHAHTIMCLYGVERASVYVSANQQGAYMLHWRNYNKVMMYHSDHLHVQIVKLTYSVFILYKIYSQIYYHLLDIRLK